MIDSPSQLMNLGKYEGLSVMTDSPSQVGGGSREGVTPLPPAPHTHRLVDGLKLLLHGQLLSLEGVERRIPLRQLRQQRGVLRALLLECIERIANLCAGSAAAAAAQG